MFNFILFHYVINDKFCVQCSLPFCNNKTLLPFLTVRTEATAKYIFLFITIRAEEWAR